MSKDGCNNCAYKNKKACPWGGTYNHKGENGEEIGICSIWMENKCYVLTCTCYSGDNSTSVYWDEQDAYKAMIEELEVEITNLQNSGYKFTSAENDISAELYVPDSDIYYEWNIEETIIR